MKTQNLKFPPSEAWDFRKVDDSALAQATLYEYARSSDKIRNAVWDCLKKKIKGKSAAEHIKAAMIQGLKTDRSCQDCLSDGVWEKVYFGLLKSTAGNFPLVDILMHRPDFPMHWLAFPLTCKRNPDSRWPLFIFPIEKGQTFRDGFHLSILSWRGETVDSLVRKFETWLREEAKNHPEMKGRGMAGQLPIAPLAWLAAYRISKAGFTYDESQERLRQENNHYGHLPNYADKSGWSGAIKRAKAGLAKLESGSWLLFDPE
jgi:hypothetical protein